MANKPTSVAAARQALESVPAGHPRRWLQMGTLVMMLQEEYERTRQEADLREAIAIAQEAIILIPKESSRKLILQSVLPYLLKLQYQNTRNAKFLHEAIQIQRSMVETTPLTHPSRLEFLLNLANFLSLWHEGTGEVQALHEAISLTEKALDLMPDSDPQHPMMLFNLATMLHDRHKYTGQMADMQDAISVVRQAIAATPVADFKYVLWSSELAVMLHDRYNRTSQEADLEESIVLSREAVKRTPTGHRMRPQMLARLGTKLRRRFKKSGRVADLQEAIKSVEDAVILTPDTHRDKAVWLTRLGDHYHTKFKTTGDLTDLEKAINHAQQSLELQGIDDSGRASSLVSLGSKLMRRFKETHEACDFEQAKSYFVEGFHVKTARPLERIDTGILAFEALLKAEEIDEAARIGMEMIDLILRVATRLPERNDTQYVLSEFPGVASALCSILLRKGCVVEALQYLEKGRAVIIGRQVDAQIEPGGLPQRELADRYYRLRDEISMPAPIEGATPSWQQHGRRVEALAELEACIQEIRQIPGQERFLLGQEAADMQKCAAGGNIVIVNGSGVGSDAIIVSPTTIKTVHLPLLKASDDGKVQRWVRDGWGGGLRSEMAQKNAQCREYLAWLWNAAVKIILNEIGAGEGGSLSRIWWIGTGFASSMPFHAAGIHTPDSMDNTLSRAISSYTPSIKSLDYAQRKMALADKGRQGSVLVVAMPGTPGLKKVGEEANQLKSIVDDRFQTKRLDLPTAQDVVANLPGCSIAHFACHGFTDHTDPSQSGLRLHSNDALTVRTVSQLHLPNARLAYLSACSTAAHGVARLRDEVIHVVSGMQTAGFPHVVGCLWPSNDEVCLQVAGTFYQTLLSTDKGVDGTWEVASALREAVLQARQKRMKSPLHWAPFVHFGV